MFNNQPTQVLVTFHEEDKAALSHLLQAASRWPNHFTIVTGNDGPYPTATLCFDGINALVHFSASGILATVEASNGNLLVLDDTVIDAKNVAIYNNGQIVDVRTIAPNGRAFIQLAKAYCYGNSTNYYQQPRSITRDKRSGFMDLSGDSTPFGGYTRNAMSGGYMSAKFGTGRPTFGRPLTERRRSPEHSVVITANEDDAYLTINGVGARLLERAVVEGGYMYKFHHLALSHISEHRINQALRAAGLTSGWIDTENDIISIVVSTDSSVPELDKLEFGIRIDSESGEYPVVVLEDKDGDLYPHMAEVYDNGFRYQSELLCGLTYANVETLNSAAEALGFNVVYDEVDGSIELITIVNDVETKEEVIPELEIKDNRILLGGVPAQVLETDNRQFEIIFDQDLPVNKHDYAATLRTLLLGRRSKGFNSSWNMDHANVLVVRLEVGDKAKSIKTMRAAVEASKVN